MARTMSVLVVKELASLSYGSKDSTVGRGFKWNFEIYDLRFSIYAP